MMVCNLEQGTVTVLVMEHREQAHFRETCGMQNKNTQWFQGILCLEHHANIQEIMDGNVREHHNIKVKKWFKLLADYSI